jgi:hypothetical protein
MRHTPRTVFVALAALAALVISTVPAAATAAPATWWKPFPAAVRGKALDGWAGEQRLDVRQWDTLRPILADRFATCKAKGFDAVDPDNTDGYANDSGFPLIATDQLLFKRRVADLAHSLGLKNDLEQITKPQPSFDFAVNESCAQWKECAMLSPFVTAGKPVFHVEYKRHCARPRRAGASARSTRTCASTPPRHLL